MNQSAFGIDHGEFSKRAPGGSLEALLKPYHGALPKKPSVESLNPANRPLTMKLRAARRNANYGYSATPGRAMSTPRPKEDARDFLTGR